MINGLNFCGARDVVSNSRICKGEQQQTLLHLRSTGVAEGRRNHHSERERESQSNYNMKFNEQGERDLLADEL